MRKFKFRVWSTERKKMIYPERDGWYRKAFKGDNGYWQTATISILFEVNKVKVMQWTGLKDKNGKEVYEGDIVETVTASGNPFGTIDVVRYQDGGFKLVDDTDSLLPIYIGDKEVISIEVIGNIYEHPHLLKEVK